MIRTVTQSISAAYREFVLVIFVRTGKKKRWQFEELKQSKLAGRPGGRQGLAKTVLPVQKAVHTSHTGRVNAAIATAVDRFVVLENATTEPAILFVVLQRVELIDRIWRCGDELFQRTEQALVDLRLVELVRQTILVGRRFEEPGHIA